MKFAVLRHLLTYCFLAASVVFPIHSWAVDADGDGVDDSIDAFPTKAEATIDTDSDGKPNSLNLAYMVRLADGFKSTAPWVISGTQTISGPFGTKTFGWQVNNGLAKATRYNNTTNPKYSVSVYVPPQGGTLSFDVDGYAGTKSLDYSFGTAAGSIGYGPDWWTVTKTLQPGVYPLTWTFSQGSNSTSSTLSGFTSTNIYLPSSLTEDDDDDNDSVVDASDAFPLDATESFDTDLDGIGNNADTDDDNDTVDDGADNCTLNVNTDQLNTDGDAQGNVCDTDDDNDGVADASDTFPLDATESVDTDGDGIGNNADTTPNGDTDGDGIDNLADTTPNGDTDGDGVDNLSDNCVSVSNADQLNTDGDTEGNACDADDDNDSVADDGDNCSLIGNANQLDSDSDTEGDACDAAPFVADAGSLDSGFNLDINGAVKSIAVQSDGKIIIGGDFTMVNGVTLNRIARINMDGSLDNTFNSGLGVDGVTLVAVNTVSIQEDGKIIIAGRFNSFNGVVRNHVARLNADGSLDTSFNVGNFSAIIYDIRVQSDGKIVIAGTFSSVNGVTRSDIARLNIDGSVDSSFNCVPSSCDEDSINKIAIQDDGKIIIASWFNDYDRANIYRINADGTLDSSFLLNGRDIGDFAPGFVLLPDGKIIIDDNEGYDPVLRRANVDGSFDTSFNPSGEFYGGRIAANAVQADGKIIFGDDNIRFNADGSLDSSYRSILPKYGVSATTLQADGKILIGGSFTALGEYQKMYIARLHSGDSDSDAIEDAADNCTNVSNIDQLNTDGDSEGDVCDNDDDNDSVADASDAFPLDATESVDTDGDGIGNNADTTPNGDTDGDGIDNLVDPTPNGDTDHDSVDNLTDNCPTVYNTTQTDTDHDGLGDVCDHYPDDPQEISDADYDGLPDNWEPSYGYDASKADYAIAMSTTYPYHTCSITRGTVQCSGNNSNGQTDVPAGITTARALQLGNTWSCAITDSGNVCWGTNAPTDVTPAYAQYGTVSGTQSSVHCIGGFVDYTPSRSYSIKDSHTVEIYSDMNYPGCASMPLHITHTFHTKGTISYIVFSNNYGSFLSDGQVCALTEYGVECNSSVLMPGVFDADGDSVAGLLDAFPLDATKSGDTDNDGIDNLIDNCVAVSNADQLNADGDAEGDACDSDDDNDSVADVSDAFPLDATESLDTDGDGIGNNADTTPNGDTDSDGVDNLSDNCAVVSNANQLDTDNDNIGDVCDTTPNGDIDNDGIDNATDNCIAVSNASQNDTDNDGVGDACDSTVNGDTDNDGIDNLADNCSAVSNVDQINTDGDTQGDACDTTPNGDTDGDGVDNNSDNCPAVSNADQIDLDADGAGDVCDLFPLDGELLLEQNGTARNENFASSVAMADMNDDGVVDVLIGAPMANVLVDGKTLKKAGVIRIISGADNSILRTLNGTVAHQQFGTAMAVVDDQNGDTVPDVVVGEPLADITTTVLSKTRKLKNAGRVAVYSGSDGTQLNVIAEGSKTGDHFGAAVAVGDLNSDANIDLVVGAPNARMQAKRSGQVTVFNGLSSAVLYQSSGDQAGESFGAAVAVDHQRLYVGSPLRDVFQWKDAGRVQVFNTANGSNHAFFIRDGAAQGGHFGAAISAANDEWAVGIPLADNIGKDAGSVQLFSGLNITPVTTLSGKTAGDNFGSAVNMQGDVNQDGKNDLAIGAAKFDVSTSVEKRKSAGIKTVLLKDAGRMEVLSGTALESR